MAVQLPDNVIEGMAELGCSIRFTSETVGMNLVNTCWVTDLATGVTYANGKGENELAAASEAIANAKVKPKPLTKAQSAYSGVIEENAKLRAELAALKGEPIDGPTASLSDIEEPKPKRTPRKVEII